MNSLESKISYLLKRNVKNLNISWSELEELLKVSYFLDIKNKKKLISELRFLVKNNPSLFNILKSKLSIEKEEDFFRIPLVEYLKLNIEEEKYKIYYMNLEQGFVYIPFFEFEDFLISVFIKPIKNENEDYKRIAEKFKEKKLYYVKKKEGDLPPCVLRIIENMSSNPSHTERWFLAVFLINYGFNDEEILKIFSEAPNYNEKKTKYFLEHIRKKRYLPYSCSSLKSFGICVAECKVRNPLSYGKKK